MARGIDGRHLGPYSRRRMAVDPIRKLGRWLADARRAGAELAEAAALATADGRGRPSVRYVLVKSIGKDGVVFYTNAASRKGRELAANPHAALAIYWQATGKQVRVEGKVRPVSEAEADAYWAERPRTSQAASAASNQSRPLAARAVLLREYRRLERAAREHDVPRPAVWTGYRIIPNAIEFWTRAEPRLHHRELFERKGHTWTRKLLQP